MSKNISLSDDVYERLEREKGDRSFSELIADLLESRTSLAAVSGNGVLDEETYAAVKEDVRTLSQVTSDRLEDETP